MQRARTCLGVVLAAAILVACKKDAEPTSGAPAAVAVTCTSPATAPVATFPEVRTDRVLTNDCGDVVFTTTTGEVTLRRSDGATEALGTATESKLGALDAENVFFVRGDEVVFRPLRGGAEVVVGTPADVTYVGFGRDAAGRGLPFFARGGEIWRWNGSAFVAIEGVRGATVVSHAREGAIVLADRDHTLLYVDLEQGRVVTGPAYRPPGSNADRVIVTRDGRLVLLVTGALRTEGGVTFIAAGPPRVLDPRTGTDLASPTLRDLPYEIVQRDGIFVGSAGGADGIQAVVSIDTRTGKVAEHVDAIFVSLQDDGTLVLTRRTPNGNAVVRSRPGSREETPWLELPKTLFPVVASPSGTHLHAATARGCTYGWCGEEGGVDLVVVRPEGTSAPVHLAALGHLDPRADGSAVLVARAPAEDGGLSQTTEAFLLSPAGALTKIEGTAGPGLGAGIGRGENGRTFAFVGRRMLAFDAGGANVTELGKAYRWADPRPDIRTWSPFDGVRGRWRVLTAVAPDEASRELIGVMLHGVP